MHVGQVSENCPTPPVSGGPCLGTTHGVLHSHPVLLQNATDVVHPLLARCHIWCSADKLLITAKDERKLAVLSWVTAGVLLELNVAGLREQQANDISTRMFVLPMYVCMCARMYLYGIASAH